MRIAIVADHNGVAFKARVVAALQESEHTVDDRGVHTDEIVDYPALCLDACRQVLDGAAERAIVIGGTGSGEQMVCNKVAGIRAIMCQQEMVARISRQNNDSNVLVLGAKVIAPALGTEIVDVWLRTAFSGGRHAARLQQMAAIERGEWIARDR
jgi:ribose 5-phosphate isomerase B